MSELEGLRRFRLQTVERYEGYVDAASEDEAVQMWREGAVDLELDDEEISDIQEVPA